MVYKNIIKQFITVELLKIKFHHCQLRNIKIKLIVIKKFAKQNDLLNCLMTKYKI